MMQKQNIFFLILIIIAFPVYAKNKDSEVDNTAVKNFINEGAGTHTKNNNDGMQLILAAFLDSKDTVKMLFENGAPVNTKNKYGWTCFASDGIGQIQFRNKLQYF